MFLTFVIFLSQQQNKDKVKGRNEGKQFPCNICTKIYYRTDYLGNIKFN